MNRFLAFLRVAEWLGAIVVLFGSAQPALYQLRISYRQVDPVFQFWIATAIAVAATLLARRMFAPREGRTGFGSHHFLQLATATGISTSAIFQLAVIGTIDTAGVHPAFVWLYLPIHAAIVIAIAWRTAPATSLDGTVLLVVLAGVNGRLFSADFAYLLPLALTTLGRLAVGETGSRLRFATFERGMLALVLLGAAATVASPQPDGSYVVWVRFACVVAIGACVALHSRDLASARAFLGAHVATGLALCGFAALVAAFALEHATPRAVFNTRFQIFNAHPNLTGPFHAVNATLTLGYLLYLARTRLHRLMALAALGLFLVVLVQGGSKAALGSFAIGALLVLLLGRFRVSRWLADRRIRLALVAVPLLAIAVLAIAPRGMRDRLTPAGIRQTLEYRFDIWGATSRVIAEHPWLGVGIENYSLAAAHLESTTAQDEKREPHPHNLYLAVAQATGLPGLACFLAALAALFARALAARRAAASNDEIAMLTVCAAAVALVLVASLVDVGLGLGTFVPPTLVLIGAVMSGLSSRRSDGAVADREVANQVAHPRRVALGFAAVIVAGFTLVVLRQALVSREICAARLAARAGAADAARERYEAAQKLDPFNPAIAYALVDLYRTTGSNDVDRRAGQARALSVLEKLATRTPDDPSLYFKMAQIRRDRREPDEAIASIRAAIERAPDMVTSAPYYVELGILLWAAVKDRDGCFDAFKHALILDIAAANAIPWIKTPRGDGYDDQRVVIDGVLDEKGERVSFELEDIIADIVADYEAEIARGEPPNVLEWLKVFHMYLNAGDFDEAFAIAERIGRFPNFHLVTIARELADVEAKRGNLDAAIGHYRQALAARPNFAIYQGAAAAYRRSGNLELARSHLEASLSLKEDLIATSRSYRETYLRLADIAREQGDGRQARRHLRHALFFAPQPSERLPIQLALLRVERELGEFDAAIGTAEAAIDVLIVAGIDLVQQGLDDPVRELATETLRVCGPDTAAGQRRILELSDPERQQSASPAFSTFAAWCRLGLDDLDGAQEMLKRSREENRINRLADLAAIDLLIAGGRRDGRDALFSQLGEIDVRTQYRALRETRLKARFDAARGDPADDLLLEIADHYFVVGEFAEAARHYGQLVNRRGSDPRFDVRLARALYFQGDSASAAALFRRAMERDPSAVLVSRLARGATL